MSITSVRLAQDKNKAKERVLAVKTSTGTGHGQSHATRKRRATAIAKFPEYLATNMAKHPLTPVAKLVITFCELWDVDYDVLVPFISAEAKEKIRAQHSDHQRRAGRAHFVPTLERQEMKAYKREVGAQFGRVAGIRFTD